MIFKEANILPLKGRTGPGSLDKKGGRKVPYMFHLCLIKDGTVFPLFSLTNEPGTVFAILRISVGKI
jgi:hypothetical protein